MESGSNNVIFGFVYSSAIAIEVGPRVVMVFLRLVLTE